MGWCSGTPIFDAVAKTILDSELSEERQYEIMRTLTVAMYDGDWDCEDDSEYYKHPIIRRVMRDLNPDLDWDEIDALAED